MNTKRDRSMVSVVMAVYNGVPFIKEAIESILKQSYKDMEFIIVDDHSTDQTAKIIKTFRDKRIRLVTNVHRRGLAASLNQGLRLVSGKYIARMDADDVSYPERFKEQVMPLDEDSDLALVGSWTEIINEDGQTIGIKRYPASYEEIKRSIMRFNPFVHPSVMIRRSVLKKIGSYDEKLDGAEDYDLFLRIVNNYQAINLPLTLLKYRVGRERISYREMKKVERAAIAARIKALTRYHYPAWQAVYLVKPALSYLVPASVKQFILDAKH